MKKINKKFNATGLVFFIILTLVGPSAAHAATAPTLGSSSAYGVISSTLVNTTAGAVVGGDVCYTTGPAVTPTISGATVTPCNPARGTDQSSALADINSQSCTSLGAAVALNNVAGHATGIYTPGCYSSTGAMDITANTNVTLDGGGNSNAVFIFKSAAGLTTGANTSILLTNGATAANVFWAPTEAATLGANTAFVGNILDAAGISLGHLASLLGRAMAYGGTVTADSNTITIPATLHVIKTVVNSHKGAAVASDFKFYVKLSGADVAGSPANGSTTGTTYSLAAGTYVISEDANPSYTQLFSMDCNSSGSVTLAGGQDKTCVITNTDILLPAPMGAGGSAGSFLPLPLIDIVKIPSPLALPAGPGPVAYVYTVTNVGVTPMSCELRNTKNLNTLIQCKRRPERRRLTN